MRAFRFSRIDCSACGAAQSTIRPRRFCVGCGKEGFSVEIERSASGFDPGDILGTLDADTEDLELYHRTHSLLRCGGIFGKELTAFMRASLPERKRLYIAWKRREVQTELGPDHAICDRCGVAFKVYRNAWNGAGLCSKACHQAYLKSQAR